MSNEDTTSELSAKLRRLGDLGVEITELLDNARRLRDVGVVVPEAAELKLKKRRHYDLALEIDRTLKASGVEDGLKELLGRPMPERPEA